MYPLSRNPESVSLAELLSFDGFSSASAFFYSLKGGLKIINYEELFKGKHCGQV